MKKKDIILALSVLAVAIVMYVFLNLNNSSDDVKVKVTVEGEVYGEYSLNDDMEIEISTKNGKNIVKILDGYVQMKEADCPDKYCVKQGKINKSKQNIVCLPHKVIVEIVPGDDKKSKDSNVDAIAQ